MKQSINQEVIQAIKDAVDVESLLNILGVRITKNGTYDLRSPCPIHGGDNPTAFSIRTDTKRWVCFTKHCEMGSTGRPDNDLVSLIIKLQNLSFIDAVRFLADFSGVPIDSDNQIDGERYATFKRRREIDKYIRTVDRLNSRDQELPELSESIVSEYISNRDDYFIRMGFSEETLDLFEVGAKIDTRGILRATVPIRDEVGRLVSVSARREDGDEEPRYLLEREFEKSRVLYNLHRAAMTGSNTVIIVEGFKASWAVYEAGFSNVVACMGSMVLPEQVYLLLRAGFMNCLLMLDGDKAGKIGSQNSQKILSRSFKTVVSYLPNGYSPDSDGFERHDLKDFIDLHLELLD